MTKKRHSLPPSAWHWPGAQSITPNRGDLCLSAATATTASTRGPSPAVVVLAVRNGDDHHNLNDHPIVGGEVVVDGARDDGGADDGVSISSAAASFFNSGKFACTVFLSPLFSFFCCEC